MAIRKVFIGADHAGVRAKRSIVRYLEKLKIPYEDLGSDNPDTPDDYDDHAARVCRRVIKDKGRGILICGSGTGMVIAANRFRGIRAAMCYDDYTASMARHDNDANVLTLRARGFTSKHLIRIVSIWLSTPFSNIPRHKRRIKKLDALR